MKKIIGVVLVSPAYALIGLTSRGYLMLLVLIILPFLTWAIRGLLVAGSFIATTTSATLDGIVYCFLWLLVAVVSWNSVRHRYGSVSSSNSSARNDIAHFLVLSFTSLLFLILSVFLLVVGPKSLERSSEITQLSEGISSEYRVLGPGAGSLALQGRVLVGSSETLGGKGVQILFSNMYTSGRKLTGPDGTFEVDLPLGQWQIRAIKVDGVPVESVEWKFIPPLTNREAIIDVTGANSTRYQGLLVVVTRSTK